MKRGTKESRFMIALYKEAVRTGDLTSPVSAQQIGSAVGVNRRALQNVVQTLCHINFLKKHENGDVALTLKGIEFVRELLNTNSGN